MHWRADHDVETTDWRAVCGRTARTVRRAGRAKALPDPYRGVDVNLMALDLSCYFLSLTAEDRLSQTNIFILI